MEDQIIKVVRSEPKNLLQRFGNHLSFLKFKHKKIVSSSVFSILLLLAVIVGAQLVQNSQEIRSRAAGITGQEALTTMKQRVIADFINSYRTADDVQNEKYFTDIKSDGSFPDYIYPTISTQNSSEVKSAIQWENYAHLQRLAAMTVYCRAKEKDASYIQKIELSLNFINNRINQDGELQLKNWITQIGMPVYGYGPILLLMEGRIGTDLFNQSKTMMQTIALPYVPDPNDFGTNVVHRGMAVFYTALIFNDTNTLDTAKIALTTGFTPTGTSLSVGIRPDYSYLFHGALLYTGGYGQTEPLMASLYNSFATGTSYQLSDDLNKNELQYALNGIRWIYYKGGKDIYTMGREMHHFTDPAFRIDNFTDDLTTLLHFWQTNPDPSTNASLVGTLKNWLNELGPTYSTSMGYQSIIEKVKSDPNPEIKLEGHKYYPFADYTIHRKADYYVSVRTISSRTKASDIITNNEGYKTWFFADGAMFITLSGREFFNDKHVLTTFDWTRIPGTTVEQRTYAGDEAAGHEGTKNIVGGVSYNDSGVTAMDFQGTPTNTALNISEHEPTLVAKKSWFFFGNEIVALGSNIGSASPYRVDTNINQWPIFDNPTTPLIVNGVAKPTNLGWSEMMAGVRWMHHNQMGYYFPNSQTVTAWRLNQSGSPKEYQTLPTEDQTTYTNPFFKFFIIHGVKPTNASYAYALLPLLTAQQTEAYAASSPLQILSNDSSAHAVWQKNQQALGVVFWNNSKKIHGFSVNKPAVVFAKYLDSGKKIDIALAEPTNQRTTVTLTLDGNYSGVNLPSGGSLSHPSFTNQTKISIPVSNGVTVLFQVTTAKPTVTPTPIPSFYNPKGFQDSVNGGTCSTAGWACDQDLFSSAIKVRFYEGSTLVGETTAGNQRVDVKPVCGGYDNHGFNYTFPTGSVVKNGRAHTITVKAVNINSQGVEIGTPVTLKNTPRIITCYP